MVDKEGLERFCGGHMHWGCWQSQVNLPNDSLWCTSTLDWLGIFFIKLVRRVLNNHFMISMPGLGFCLGAGFFPLPIATGFPPVFFLAVFFVRAM